MPTKQGKRHLVAAMSILVIAVSCALLILRQCNGGKTAGLEPFAAAGEVMAEEANALLGGHGRIVVVTFDTAKTQMPQAMAQLKAFQKRLRDQSGLSVAAVETLNVNPSPGMAAWSVAQYYQLVQRLSDVDAIVSFVGPPLLMEPEMRRPVAQLPRLLVFTGFNPGVPLRKLFERGVVQVALVNRFTPPPRPASTPHTYRDWFDQFFQVVQTDTARTLAY